MPQFFIDIETRSGVNLHDHGAHVYAIDSSTEPLCMVWAIDDGEPILWLPTNPVPSVFAAIAENPRDQQLIAHNYLFEIAIYEHILVPRYGFPAIPRSVWHCTQRLAMANARPAELGLLCQALGLPYTKESRGP